MKNSWWIRGTGIPLWYTVCSLIWISRLGKVRMSGDGFWICSIVDSPSTAVRILSMMGSSESENVSIRIFPISYHSL